MNLFQEEEQMSKKEGYSRKGLFGMVIKLVRVDLVSLAE